MFAWRGSSFAHRGLHGSCTENTLSAFEAACAHKCGIELDVQLSRDGTLVVFHDNDLLRLFGDERRVDQLDLEELGQLRLPGDESIPTLAQVLALVDGRVPLLVELKNGSRNLDLCRKTRDLLSSYKGRYIVESFNPLILAWWRKNARKVLRGQLVSAAESYSRQCGKLPAWLLSNLCLNMIARPDFISYDLDFDFAAPKLQRALFRTPMACWTVRTPERYQQAIENGEMPIFEGFVPDII